jgi:large repetitive protein
LDNDSDPDGILDVASVAVIEEPASGQSAVDLQTGAIDYTPNPGPAREDRFRYQACDTQGSCAQAAVVVTITNLPPIVQGDSADIKRAQSISINVLANDRDPEGALDPTTVRLLRQPDHGQATVQPDATIAYLTIARSFDGDVFDYQVCDAQGLCAQATVTVTATATAMIAAGDRAATPSRTAVLIAVLANDQAPDSQIDPSSLKVVRDPANGQTNLDLQAGTIEYIPDSKCEISGSLQIVVACGKTTFIGDDNFEYQVCNTEGECANAQVSITVTNQSPILEGDAVVTTRNTPVSIPISDNDSDPEDELDLASLQIITQPSHGTLSADTQQSGMLYTPEKGYVGDDSFVYQLCDLRKA